MPESPAAATSTRHIWPLAVVVVAGSIMSILDTTIVNVALQTLSVDLDSPIESVQWVVTGYMLALAAVIPVSGWAARRIGTRRLYLVSLALFTLGSMLCGLAWSIDSLIAFRVLQGLGGGMLMPTGMIILARAAGPHRMGRILSVIGVPMVLAPVFGPCSAA
jgi:MFS family permease